jgi:hypothetical protein
MTQVLDMPLNGGQDEGTDRILLPSDGTKFRLMQNCRLDRIGRIAVRPQYTTLTSLSACDQLATYKDRLVSLGKSYYLNTYTPELSVGLTAASPIGALSAVENLWQNPSGAAARQFDVAYAAGTVGGILCVVQVDDSNVLTVTKIATADGTQLSRTQISPISSARVVACGTTFVIVTRGTTGTMAARTLGTTVGTTPSAPTTLEATVATGTTHWDLCSIPGTTDYLVTYPRPGSTSVRLRRYTVAHALSATLDVTPTTAVGDLAVAAASTSVIVWAITDGAALKLRTLDGSLTVTTGPATVSTTAGIRAPGLAFGVNTTFGIDVGRIWIAATTATASELYLCLVTNYATITLSDASAPNVWGASKPFTVITSDLYGAGMIVGRVSAGSAFSLPFYTACVYDAAFPANVHGVWDYGVCAPLDILSASDTGGRASVASDGTYYYALTTFARGLELGGSVPGALRVVKISRDHQRQCVEAGGILHISGGNVGTYDGAVLSTASFPNAPDIISIAQDASGAQTLLAAYQYIATYEFVDASGNTVRSTPSAPIAVTLTGGNNRAIPTVSTPRTAKRVGNGITPRVVLYRANPGDSVFFRVAESSDVSALDTAATVAINDGVSDVIAETHEILYTQSQKPVTNVAPGAAKYLAVGRDRVLAGGLQDPNQVKLSQLFAPGEPPEFAHPAAAGFVARLPQPCTGVAASGDTYVAFTRDAIFAIPGSGPQRNGSGEFFAPQTLYADGGCIDWRSIVSCGAGIFFQLDTDKLYVLRPGGQAEWIGQPIQDTLASYPVIVGACLCSATQQVVFACNSTDGTTGALLVYDIATSTWYTDDILADTVTEYQGKLAYFTFNTGNLSSENTAAGLGSGTALTASIRTGSLRPFGVSGFGDLYKIQLLGTYVGDSTVEAFLSLDDGKTWTSLGSVAATAANTALGNNVSGSALASGDTITLEWQPNGGGNLSRFALRFDITEATDTGALRVHALALEVQAAQGTARLAAGMKN